MSFVEQVGCVTLYCGDNLKVLPTLSRVTAVVTDPPYALTAKNSNSKGFMGMKWDGAVPSIELWKVCLEAMSPGAHLLSFAAPRTQHRIAVNIEDAGFDIRDVISWVFATGMPKGLDVGKAIDKELGAERQVIGEVKGGGRLSGDPSYQSGDYGNGWHGIKITNPATPEAQCWNGYNVNLKPAYEPIIVARKPLDGTVAKNCLKHGCGALNIDECRIKTEEDTRRNARGGENGLQGTSTFKIRERRAEDMPKREGRYPANFIHDGSDEVVALFPKQAGGGFGKRGASTRVYGSGKGFTEETGEDVGYGDQGSAARFFYTAKVSPSERTCNGKVSNTHPTIKPKALMSYLLTLVKQPERNLILDPFAGSGSTGLAALELGLSCVLIEREREYFDIALARLQAHHKALQAA